MAHTINTIFIFLFILFLEQIYFSLLLRHPYNQRQITFIISRMELKFCHQLT
jgi:hypothetical protein